MFVTVLAANMLARVWGLPAFGPANMLGSALGSSDPASPSANTDMLGRLWGQPTCSRACSPVRCSPAAADDFEMEEFLQPRTMSTQPFTWSRSMTLFLIELIRVRTPLVPSRLKTMKAMYTSIAEDINEKFGANLSATQVANKMKSLERAYKDITDNNNATGRKRKDFEFEGEMSDLMSKKKTVNPVILLSDSGVEHHTVQEHSMVIETVDTVFGDFDFEDQEYAGNTPLIRDVASGSDRNTSNNSTTPRRVKTKKVTRVDVLNEIRKDRLKAMEKKLAVDERIAAAIEKKNQLEQRKLDLLRIVSWGNSSSRARLCRTQQALMYIYNFVQVPHFAVEQLPHFLFEEANKIFNHNTVFTESGVENSVPSRQPSLSLKGVTRCLEQG
ncbi:hypothetical protein GE061_004834 [Apolygus lucorum]|uniref:Myb/SANT-like DNA-binding domain-containing protein n=1 Tax=Apolygus lucorum TaxID=248454 RepID=A0A8S9X4B8_APOLU|nr:hypothetical protein GE061_004834 [Apolygus lucorum]